MADVDLHGEQEVDERTRLVLEAVGEAVVGVDMRGVCVFANPACARLLGYGSIQELSGKDVRELTLPPQPRDGEPGRSAWPRPRPIDELCLEEAPAHVAEERFARADGTSFWAEVWSRPIRRYGRRVGAVITFVDITERKHAAEERERLMRDLEEAVRVRDEFLAIASHELRTPLTPLQLNVQGLLRTLTRAPESLTPPQLLARIEAIARQVRRLETLTDELLDLSRLTSRARMLLQLEEVDMGQLVRDVVARCRDDLARARCEIRVDVDGLVVGAWDRQRLEQIASNLLSNAMKFGAGKAIELRVSSLSGASVRVEVRDHGIGIAPEDQRRVFERFERAVPSRYYGGFGLGLWTVRRNVEAMGGTVALESSVGHGALFTVELPVRPEARAQALAS